MRPVNFIYNRSPSYKLVQDQIFGLIEVELGGVETSRTIEAARNEAVNFGLHIRLGRHNNVPMPIDVLMSHGLADKSYLLAQGDDGSRLINAYEHVVVAGEWFVSRLMHRRWHPLARKRVTIGADRIHIGGWPRCDRFYGSAPVARAPGPIRLLWAPSHNISTRERSFSSFPAFEPYLARLAEEFDVRVSLHPSNRTDKSPTQGALDWADVVVSDFGTLLYEAWAAGKCVIIPAWLIPPDISRGAQSFSAEGYIYRKRIGHHARSFDELVEMARSLEGPDVRVAAFMNRILEPRYRGSSAARIADLLRHLPIARLGDANP